jgi:hypothetical protein
MVKSEQSNVIRCLSRKLKWVSLKDTRQLVVNNLPHDNLLQIIDRKPIDRNYYVTHGN